MRKRDGDEGRGTPQSRTKRGGPRTRRGGPYAHRSMFAPRVPSGWPEGCRKISKIGWGAWPREIAQPTQLPRLTFRWLSVRMITPAWVLLLPSISGYRAASECPPRRCSSLQLPSRSHNGFARGQITASETKPAGPEAGSGRARASDILLTRDAYEIEPGWACRAEPESGVGDVPPTPALLSSSSALLHQ